MKQSGFNPCRECGVIPEVYAFGKVAKCLKCKQIQSGENLDHLVFEWNKANPKPGKSNESNNKSSNEFELERWEDDGGSTVSQTIPISRGDRVALEPPKNNYSDMLEAIKSISNMLEEIWEQEKLITAKICQEEKGDRD